MEKRTIIPFDDIRLEALINRVDDTRAGIVTHPHPLFGGSMDNNVVQAGITALVRSGWTGLRFNFRGVGGSSGRYSEGMGEQEDLTAAVGFLKDRGFQDILVMGYSFGAHVAAFAWPQLEPMGVRPLVLIAPPAAYMNFDGLPTRTRIGLMVCGRHDEIGPPDLAADFGARLEQPLEPIVVPQADHFFSGQEGALIEILGDYLDAQEN